jgi:hypothetical protein
MSRDHEEAVAELLPVRLLTRHPSGILRVDGAPRPVLFHRMLSRGTTHCYLRIACWLQCTATAAFPSPCSIPWPSARPSSPRRSRRHNSLWSASVPLVTTLSLLRPAWGHGHPLREFSTGCSQRARPPLREFSTGCSQRARPPLREFSTGCSQRARPPVVFECAAGPPVVFECAAGPPVVSGCAAGARLLGNSPVPHPQVLHVFPGPGSSFA